MKNYIKLMFLFVSLFSSFTYGQDNIELQRMADEDQKARLSGGRVDWEMLVQKDSLRRVRVYQLFEADEVQTPKDYLNAGIIFQHGNDTVSSKMAVTCFDKAITKDSSLNRWWYAAAVDRDLMRRGKPQVYGTQYINVKGDNGEPIQKQYDIDTTQVTDKERQYYYVPTLAEQRRQNKRMNLKTIGSFYSNSNSIDKTIELIKSEYKKGEQAEYNVSEMMINMFGYNLINSNKNKEALKVFNLNVELFPESANVYDSYGECLLKLGENQKAKKAYKRALELNPDNKNAENILKKI